MASRNQQTSTLNSFLPGLTTQRPAPLLGSGEATSAINVDLSRGTIRRRTGFTSVDESLPSTTADVQGLFAFYFGSTKYLLAIAGTYLMRSTGGDYTTITSSFAPSAVVRPSFVSLNNKAYIAVRYGADLAQTISSWDGTTFDADVAGSPTSSIVTKFANALWAAGDTAAPSRIRWSGLVGVSGPDTWPATNFIDLDPGDGDRIVGMGYTHDALVVFKERSIFVIRGQAPDDASVDAGTLGVQRLDRQPGCVAGATVSSVAGTIVYLNNQGLYLFDGVKAVEITEGIRPFFADVDPATLKNASGGFISPTRYLLSIKDAVGAIKVLHVDLQPYTRTTWTGQDINCATSFNFTTDGEKPVVGLLAGKIRYEKGNTDNGTAVSWSYTTGMLSWGPSTWLKFLRWGYLRAKASTEDITITIFSDFATTGNSIVVPTTQLTTEDPVTKRVVVPGFGRSIQFKFSGSSTSTGAEISEYTVDYMLRNVP